MAKTALNLINKLIDCFEYPAARIDKNSVALYDDADKDLISQLREVEELKKYIIGRAREQGFVPNKDFTVDQKEEPLLKISIPYINFGNNYKLKIEELSNKLRTEYPELKIISFSPIPIQDNIYPDSYLYCNAGGEVNEYFGSDL